MDSLLVTSYENLDLDGYACAFAYAELLNKTGVDAKAGICGNPHPEASWVIETYNIPPLPQINPEQYNNIVILDTSNPEDLDKRIALRQVVEIIDHRSLHHADKFSNAKVQIELVGACATLVAERFLNASILPSKASAILLHAAIISGTVNFQNNVTTQRDKIAATWLEEISTLPPTFALEMFSAKSDLSGDKLREQMIGDFAHQTFSGKRVGITQLEIAGTEKLLKERFEEIISLLRHLKSHEKLDFCFLSIIDLENAYNTYVTEDSQSLLTNALDVQFTKHIARRPGFLMRKETWPLIKAYLERGR